MRKIDETEHKEKSVPVTSRNTFTVNQIEHLSGDSNGLSAFDFTQNSKDLQCEICNPPLQKERGTMKLCANCTARGERIGKQIFLHINRPRKVIRLQRCFACNRCFALSKFSQYFGICKECLGNRDEPIPMRRKFAARALNNIQKVLQGAMCL